MSDAGRPLIVFVCTGNAARSVIAGAAVEVRVPHVEVATAGTLVVEGQPMSWRTRAAIEAVGVEPPHHRSRQATERHLADATLIVGLAPEHVEWIRRTAPSLAPANGNPAAPLPRPATCLRLVVAARCRARARPDRPRAVGGGRRPGWWGGGRVHRLCPRGDRPGRPLRRGPGGARTFALVIAHA